jgi:methylmalonyl-CoA mutase, N-terminal domain
VTLQALAAVLGGAQSLHTNSMDEALSLPTEKAVRLAIRTQQVLAHESGIANTVDPAGGSRYLEDLTDRLEDEAQQLLSKVESKGGMLRAIESGWVQRQIADSAYRFQLELERGDRTIVGVNAFQQDQPAVPEHAVEARMEEKRIVELKAFRAHRPKRTAADAVGRVIEAAQSIANVMPAILDAVRARATLGEIAGGLGEVFGSYRPRSDV